MDYLDAKKQFRQQIILFIGYGCVAIAITIGALVLVYQAYGFGVTRKGQVVQSGLTFFSSQPSPATISLSGVEAKSKTDTRLVLPENIYKVVLSRAGYQNWERTIQVDGGTVRHYDYPFLIPNNLVTKKVASYTAAPGLMTQSMDHRWLLVHQVNSNLSFDLYDLKSSTKLTPVTITLPQTAVTATTGTEAWKLSEWADDDTHVVLQHIYDNKSEYVLVDRNTPANSINLSATLGGNVPVLTLSNRKYDRYYIHNPATGELQTASLTAPAPVTLLQKVIAYKTYDNDTVLYATGVDAPKGKVAVRLRIGDHTTTLRTLPADTTYLLDLTTYSNSLYVVLGASSENKVMIYKDPVGQLQQDTQALAPAQVLHVNQPNYVSFSSSAQYIVAENGTHFGVYDIENDRGYNYVASQPIDAPAVHAVWMDGNRLTYVSKGKQLIFDYDYINQRPLEPTTADYVPAFSADYKYVYTIAPSDSTTSAPLTQTALRIPTDL